LNDSTSEASLMEERKVHALAIVPTEIGELLFISFQNSTI